MFVNYGDICNIKGDSVEQVDCIIGGSPCQDLSIAGSKQGLSGSQSRLFLEQMRVVEEMRVSSNGKKPRYMVWENVTNSLSCNKGKDFQHVLMECINVAVRTSFCMEQKQREHTENSQTTRDKRQYSIPDVPMPKNGKWAKSGILYDDLGRWSIAWRIHDAQYWGVAQRRRRIALVVDFGGLTAPEVLFESKSMSGDINKSYTQRERTSERTIGSITESSEQSYIYDARGNGSGKLASTLTGDHDNRVTDYTNVVLQKEPYLLESNQNHATINNDGICTTLPASMGMGGGYVPMITQKYYDTIENKDNSNLTITENKNHKIETIFKESVFVKAVHENQAPDINLSSIAYPITTGGGKPEQSYPCICIGNGQSHVTNHYTKEISQTLNCMHDPMTILEPRNNCNYLVRRLTPLECTRLQGFPDGWVDIGDWVDSKGKKHKEADAPKYKALGNSIALPFWKWLCKNIVNKIKEKNDYNYIPTMASLFAGIGGFDLCWYEATGTKESIKWVSEIEEFPIAVLKNHF